MANVKGFFLGKPSPKVRSDGKKPSANSNPISAPIPKPQNQSIHGFNSSPIPTSQSSINNNIGAMFSNQSSSINEQRIQQLKVQMQLALKAKFEASQRGDMMLAAAKDKEIDQLCDDFGRCGYDTIIDDDELSFKIIPSL